MTETKPIAFSAMQHTLLQDLKYCFDYAYDKATHDDIDYGILIDYLESALDRARSLRAIKQRQKAIDEYHDKDLELVAKVSLTVEP